MGSRDFPQWDGGHVVVGDFNADLEAPRGAREAELADSIADWAAMRGCRGKVPEPPPAAPPGGPSAIVWTLLPWASAGSCRIDLQWRTALSDHAALVLAEDHSRKARGLQPRCASRCPRRGLGGPA